MIKSKIIIFIFSIIECFYCLKSKTFLQSKLIAGHDKSMNEIFRNNYKKKSLFSAEDAIFLNVKNKFIDLSSLNTAKNIGKNLLNLSSNISNQMKKKPSITQLNPKAFSTNITADQLLLEDHPFKLPDWRISNVKEASQEGLDNALETIPLISQTLFGGKDSHKKAANSALHQSEVLANHVLLTSTLGVQPTENNVNGEFKRVTQVPEIKFNLRKETEANDLSDLKDIMFQKTISMEQKKDDLNYGLSNLKSVIDYDNKVQQLSDVIHNANRKMLEKYILNDNDTSNLLSSKFKEQVKLKNPTKTKQIYTPIADYLKYHEILNNTPWFPKAERTIKLAKAPKNLIARQNIKKHSSLETNDNKNIYIYKKVNLLNSIAPTIPERFDS